MAKCLALLAGLLLWARPACLAEDLHRTTFDGLARESLFQNTWGDKPVEVLVNGVEAQSGHEGAGGRLKLQFGEDAPNNLSYWTLSFPEPVPIVPQMEAISFRVKANVPVSIKIPISPFGFIYHGPTVQPSEDWQQVTVAHAYSELKAWCLRGEQDADFGLIPGVIVAIGGTKGAPADVSLDDVAITGAEGAIAAAARELQRRRYRRVGVGVVTLPWSEQGRTLKTVLDRLDEAAQAGSDIVCLPMECVKSDGEAIPGPLSEAIAGKAAEHRMYVIGNLREAEGDGRYVTSFLCDRAGQIVGKYRKSHKLPDEDMDLGDDLPVFKTDFATIAMRVGSDRYFADIDHVYTAKGARMIFWSQQPEPVEDEYLQDMPGAGRAVDYNVFIACARYSFDAPGWITNKFPPYRGCPIGRSYVINREGQRVAATARKGSVATAVIPFSELQGNGRGASSSLAFSVLTEQVTMPQTRQWAKRRIRVTAIENHVGIEDLLAKLDEAGRMGTDIVCTYEFVWISGGSAEHVAAQTARAKENLRRIAEKARQWGMYVLVAGVVDRLERNEAIVYGRDGEEVGRYYKVIQTHDEQVCGDETPIIETDFGRIGVRICADEALVELDRSYGVKGADIIFTPTQSWGPDALYRNLRDISRCMDAQMFHVQATHSCTEAMHRSVIIEPTGVPVARSQYRSDGLVTAVIDLDRDRPQRYVRNFRPHTPAGYLPEYQPTELPEERNDLKETILQQRRPELYQVLAPKTP